MFCTARVQAGAAYLVGEPIYMAAMLVAIPMLLVRRHRLAVRA